jgi:tRNA threonylcarbamoyl adenosine modification protein (Sua5/YciO/YrdC/YwlC family)
MALHLFTYDDPPAERDLLRTTQTLEDGGLIAYPTDLNWAMGCDVKSVKALERLRALKPHHKKDLPFTLIVSSIAMASDFVVINNLAYRILRKAWPGPYTVLLPVAKSLPRFFREKRHKIGIRIPESPLLLAVVERLGRPLVSTSVPKLRSEAMGQGHSDEEHVPRFGYEVDAVCGHALDLILDLGQELTGQESTVVDLTGQVPEILRVGAGNPSLFDIHGE